MNWTEEQWADFQSRLKVRPAWVSADAPKPTDMPEAVIEAECTKLLEEDGWRALRTDPVSDRAKGKGFGEIGMADHMYIRYLFSAEPHKAMEFERSSTEVLWVEFKRPREKPKKHQTAWHVRERARGALTLIAGEDFPATVAGFAEWYANSGLRRRP